MSTKRPRDETRTLNLEVLKTLFNDDSWDRDKRNKKGGFRDLVADLFETETLEVFYDEEDPHYKVKKGDVADMLQEALLAGIKLIHDVEE